MSDKPTSSQVSQDPSIYQFITIPLYDYGFVHAPHADEEHLDHLFVGREDIIKKLVGYLENSPRSRGSYLIAGYRGSGKTSLVKKAIREYRDNLNQKLPLEVNINLGDNSQLTALNIYFSIASILRDEIIKPKGSPPSWRAIFKPLVSPQNLLIYWSMLLFFVTLAHFFIPDLGSSIYAMFTQHLLALSMLTLSVPGLVWAFSRKVHPEFKVLKDIDTLIERMSSEISEGLNAALNPTFNIGLSKQRRRLPVNARDAEEQLSRILIRLHDTGRNVVFVLDEIDKLSDAEELSEIPLHEKGDAIRVPDKAAKINTLLGALKNFVTTAHATFFFISGRETLDRYYSEKGSPNSLYESLFNQVIEVPSFLTDQGERPKGTQLSALIEEYVCRRIRGKRKEIETVMQNPKDPEYLKLSNEYYTLNGYYKFILLQGANNIAKARLEVSTLRNFVHYLTFHSWGNPKRLSSIFESFIEPHSPSKDAQHNMPFILRGATEKDVHHRLKFNVNHRRSFSLASEVTTLFQHQLSREVSKISDKLTVSTLSSLQFILKLHPYGFTRESLHRMSEAINVHRSPELNAIVDDLLTQVFKSYIRRVRNGIFRYRFNSGFEQELRYISHVSELESASYNFSLDSMKHVKNFFQESLAKSGKEETGVNAKHHITLGDMCTIEQSYNEASVHYCAASRILANELEGKREFFHQEMLMQYIEAKIKHGDLEERRQNYHHAAAIYSDAERFITYIFTQEGMKELKEKLLTGDSKMDIFKQPFWASRFLSLKRSPRTIGILKRYELLYAQDDRRFDLRAANLAFFLGETEQAAELYLSAAGSSLQTLDPPYPNERDAYLEGNALVGLVETTLLHQSNIFFTTQRTQKNDLKTPKYYDELLKFAETPCVLMAKDRTAGELLAIAANRFEANRLYISAAITHIKTISYYTTILDAFEYDTFSSEEETEKSMEEKNNRQKRLMALNTKTHAMIIERGKDAIRCIDMARQLESSRSCKTILMRDLNIDASYDESISMLFEMLFGAEPDKLYPATEQVFWQNSLWAHKLASTLIWADFVKRKIESNTMSVNNRVPDDLSTLSVRSAILMRWIHARDVSKEYIDKTLEDPERASLIKYFSSCEANVSPDTSVTMSKAYDISRYLYFAMEAIRIISRKNLDLVFPRMPQIYITQWKLLSSLIQFMQSAGDEITNCSGEKMCSVRDYSLLLQKKLVDIDSVKAPHERIPPSHFDYEHIYLRLIASLDSSINLVDPTSRTRTSIFHHKYYCHDDYSDPEFRMDYTLAHMLTPAAQFLRGKIEQTHKEIVGFKGTSGHQEQALSPPSNPLQAPPPEPDNVTTS